jgi:hypothetical protein
MFCPKCGAENPDETQICSSCGLTLENNAGEKLVEKPKLSQLAITSFGLSFLSAFLFFLAAIPSIILAVVSIVQINKSAGKLKGKSFSIAAIVISILLMLTIFLWSFDAPPIPNDYTIADLRSAPPECDASYELLLSMSEKDPNIPGAPAIGLSEQDVNDLKEINKIFKEDDYGKMCAELKASEETILQIWRNAKKGRDIIDGLDAFPEIADLTEPDLKYEIHFTINFRRLFHLHRAYVCLQSYEGNEETALKELLKLDNTVRKLNANARSLVMKLMCIACFYLNIETANFIINNPHTSTASLRLLAEHFALKSEDTSLRNSIIFEYLLFKYEFTKISKIKRVKYSTFSPLKLNSTLRLYRNFCDDWIASSEGKPNKSKDKQLIVWPSIYPDLPVHIDPNGNTQWYYKAYNPIGSSLLGILLPAYDRVSQINTRMQIHYDLLQIVLNKRLNKEINLKARAYSDEYIVDLENKMIFSPGPDGKPHTKDDIKLLINPEVLKWNN